MCVDWAKQSQLRREQGPGTDREGPGPPYSPHTSLPKPGSEQTLSFLKYHTFIHPSTHQSIHIVNKYFLNSNYMPGSEDAFVSKKGFLVSWSSVHGRGSSNAKDRGQKEGRGQGVEKMQVLSSFWVSWARGLVAGL